MGVVRIVRIIVVIWILADPIYANLSLLALFRIIASNLAIASIVSAGIVIITVYCSSFTGSTGTSIASGAGVSIITDGVIVRMDTLSCGWIAAVVGAGIPIIATSLDKNALRTVK